MRIISDVKVVHEVLPRRTYQIKYFQEFPEHDTIWAMCMGLDDKVYIGLCAEGTPGCAQLYVYLPDKGRLEHIADMGEVTGHPMEEGGISQSKIHFSLCASADGTIYGATHMTSPEPGETVVDFYSPIGDTRHGFIGGHVFAYRPDSGRTELLGIITPFEGCRSMVLDDERRLLYGISFPRAWLYRFDITTRKTQRIGKIGSMGSFTSFIDKRGTVYMTDDYGRFLTYVPENDVLTELPVLTPRLPWRDGYCNFMFEAQYFSGKDVIYGTTYYDQLFFKYDLKKGPYGEITNLGHGGKMISNREYGSYIVRAPLRGFDNKIYYGFGKMWEPISFMRLDPECGVKELLGKIEQKGEKSIAIGASSVSSDGRTAYLGDFTVEGIPRLLIVDLDKI